MLLVVGATGMLGSEICRQLVAGGEHVRALVRPGADATRVTELRELGVQVVEGDLRDTASLVVACTGMRAVVSTASAVMSRVASDTIDNVDRDGQLALVAAAETAGVRHLVYTSCSGRLDVDCALVRAKRAVETRVRESRALTHTILRPTAFMEVWLTPAFGFDAVNGLARVLGTGRNRVSWIAVADVARFAVAACSHAFTRNTTLELGGPQALSPLDVVQIAEELGCQPFDRDVVGEARLEKEWLLATGEPERSLAAMRLALSRGDAIPMHRLLAFFPFQLATVRQHVAKSLRRLPEAFVRTAVEPYRYVSKNPAPSPRIGALAERPDSVARPFI